MRVEPMAKKLLITCEQNPRNLSRTPEIEQHALSRTTDRTPGLGPTSWAEFWTEQDRTRQNKTEQDRTRQNKTEQDRTPWVFAPL